MYNSVSVYTCYILHMHKIEYTSGPQLPFKIPHIPTNRDHKALNRAPLGGLGRAPVSDLGLRPSSQVGLPKGRPRPRAARLWGRRMRKHVGRGQDRTVDAGNPA